MQPLAVPGDRVRGILQATGTLLEGHFLLTSGRHSGAYVEKFRVLQNPTYTQELCSMLAKEFQGLNLNVVAGPTTGGIILAFEVARQMGLRAIFAEKQGEGRIFRRSLTLSPGERVLIVDDILTTGGSLKQVYDEVDRWGAQVVGVGVLVDRSDQSPSFGVPLFSCLRLPIPSYAPGECPLCQEGLPLVKPGGG
ncbi:MAG: orotate phosphoribosyltransferase [Dehalococcoidia bacterium]|nr:orotate phosphoribosyltransferase [Dehalococcoidia bacterium]